MSREDLDQANQYAQKCLQYDETKEEAKAFLRSIAQKRITNEANSMVVSIIKASQNPRYSTHST